MKSQLRRTQGVNDSAQHTLKLPPGRTTFTFDADGNRTREETPTGMTANPFQWVAQVGYRKDETTRPAFRFSLFAL